jgi:hypothetical protein
MPHAKKVDLYVDGKSSFELRAQLTTLIVIPCVHLIREGQLFDVAWREESDFLEHASKSASREGTPRETKNADSIAIAV